ncbi:Ger(x)C family spore germination protein [Paenibacillus sonchi]|uniref:Ger(x)C family spore germination protein n=1 Tax=Paenibacillus sonchi TaxID=373687 RepID=UPI002FCE1072|nr:Ger(x)C family spore germination protein [Paenibacillus sonchi]
MHRRWVVAIWLVTGLLLAGCGNRIEMNELGITTATGFDGQQGDWTITYQIIIPPAMASGAGGSSGGGGSQAAVHTFSAHGKTIREAVAASSRDNPRKLYFAHTNVLIIGKQAAETGIEEILDTYYRNPDARETVKVLVADGEARDFLNKLIPPEKLPGRALSDILQKNKQLSSYYPSVSVHQLALGISSDSGSAGVPEVSLTGTDSSSLESSSVFQQTSTSSKLKISGLSVFQKAKMVGTLNQNESTGISWLTDQIHLTTISYSSRDDTDVSAFLVRNAKVKVTPVKEALHYTIKVKAKVVVGEFLETTTHEDLLKTQSVKKLEQQAEQIIRTQILDGWKAVQQLKIDLVGIGNKIHRKSPKDWKRLKESWPEGIADMDMDIDVEVNLKRPGLFQSSFSRLLESEDD